MLAPSRWLWHEQGLAALGSSYWPRLSSQAAPATPPKHRAPQQGCRLTCKAKLLQQILQGIAEVSAHPVGLQRQGLEAVCIIVDAAAVAAGTAAAVQRSGF